MATLDVASSLIEPPAAHRRQLYLWTAILVSVAFAVNLCTARLSPRVWHDEVIFTDPAINLAAGRGFTSSCWPCERPNETYVGNLPLYPVLLAGWIRLLGFGIVQVRSLNYLLVSLAIFLTVVGAIRRGMIKSVSGCFLFVAGVIGGFWTSYSYRGGRYDMLGFALIAACWAAGTIANSNWRWITVGILATLVPLAAIPHAIALIVIGGIAMAMSKFTEWKTYLVATIGSIAGLAGYFIALQVSGLLPVFKKTLQVMLDRSPEFEAHAGNLFAALRSDPSTLILVGAACLVLVIAAAGRSDDRGRIVRWSVAALACATLVPVAFIITGRYPEYYCWNKYVPTLFCLIAAREILLSQPQRLSRGARWIVVIAVLISASPFVLRLGYAVKARAARDYSQVDRAARSQLRPSDRIFCSFAYYYPARAVGAQVYVPVSVEWMTRDDWNGITVAVLDSVDEALFFEHELREQWQMVDEFDPTRSTGDSSRYAFRVFRRSGPSA